MGNLFHIGIILLLLRQCGRFSVTGMDPEIAFQLGQPLQGSLNGLPVTSGQVGSSAGTGEESVAGEQGAFRQQTNGARGMAGGAEDGNGESCQMQRIALVK